ncbi:hypothetical protein C5B94_08930 [Clavibacter michiganensis]|nr:hypothetical protein C5B94_08930 [Clavibacter michiganensis]
MVTIRVVAADAGVARRTVSQYECRSGSSRHRRAFAAPSRIATSGVRMQLPALTSTRSVDASRVGAVGGGTGDMA